MNWYKIIISAYEFKYYRNELRRLYKRFEGHPLALYDYFIKRWDVDSPSFKYLAYKNMPEDLKTGVESAIDKNLKENFMKVLLDFDGFYTSSNNKNDSLPQALRRDLIKHFFKIIKEDPSIYYIYRDKENKYYTYINRDLHNDLENIAKYLKLPITIPDNIRELVEQA